MWSVAVILTFFDVIKTFFPLLAFAGNVLYQTQLNSASSSWTCLICCFCSSIIPTYCVSTLTFRKGDANVPICRHRWCWCWWRYRCCVGINLFFMSSHHCWWTIQIQCDSGCVDLKKMKSCVAYLWLTVIPEQCANGLPQLEMKSCLFPAATSEILRYFICIFLGCFKTKKIVCILVISVMSNIFKC